MDLNSENQQEPTRKDDTRVMQPVNPQTNEVKNTRRRRTERFAGLTSEADARIPEDTDQAQPATTRFTPSSQENPAQPPSQGVPRPNAMSGQRPFREQPVPQRPTIRRPVQAEGYAPLQQLGTQTQNHSRRPEPLNIDRREPPRRPEPLNIERRETPRRPEPLNIDRRETPRRPEPLNIDRRETPRRPEPLNIDRREPSHRPEPLNIDRQEMPHHPDANDTNHQETSSRVRTPETEFSGYGYPSMEEEENGGSRGLIAVIIVLLVVAAMILGLMMIPEEDTGVLGSIKRAVTTPIKRLIGGVDDPDTPASASGFSATLSQSTKPYKIVFHMVTSANVTAVRVVDEMGEVIPTKTTLSTPSSENTIVWMFEMLLEDSYTGNVQAQIQNGEKWIDTDLWQTLSLDGNSPTITEGPTQNVTATLIVATPTANVTIAPVVTLSTATPAPEKTEEVPAATEEVPTDALAVSSPAPMITSTPTISVTATPTMSVTATPTLIPTATPTVELTDAPTPELTEAPTPEPTAEPTPTPVFTPKLEAMADESADPSLIAETVIYKDGKKVSAYEREKPINMPAEDAYPLRAFGITTFRGSAFRQNAAQGTVENPTSLSQEWQVEAGYAAGSSRNFYGIGWANQPVIVKWAADIRRSMALDDSRKEQKNLKEVIVAGLDGRLYFLDLTDGTATREAINFGYPMRSTPSVHPLFYPMMTVGQYARKMKSGTSKNIGLYYYNLIDQKQLRMIDGIDRKLKRTYSEDASGAFDTSALIDRNTNTLIAIGTNGLLYTEKLSMSMQLDQDTGSMIFAFDEPSESVTMMSHTKNQKTAQVAVESSLAMYGSYAYYADFGGILRCVDTTTMTTIWAVDTGDAVRAAIALDLEENGESSTLWLYTANLIANGRTKGNVTIRRYNAMTGKEDWAFAIHCAEGKKKDSTFNAVITPGAMASPVIGQRGLNDLVYFTLSSVSATGAKTLSGEAAMPGVIIALNKATGEVVWHKAMDAYCYSSPVAVYDEAGKGWIIQACSNGTIFLLDGLTGAEISTLEVEGVIEGSPAVYDDMMVIGTTGKGTSSIYGIKIN